MLLVGLATSVAAAVLNSVAGLLEAAGGRRVRRTGSIIAQPLYLLGLAVDIVGFVLTVLALRYLPVFAVQAVLAGSIAITVLVVHRLYQVPLRPVDRLATAGCVVGLAAVAAGAAGGDRPPPAAAGVVLVLAAAVLTAAAVPLWRAGGAVPRAVLAGLAFGGVALAVRAVHLSTTLATDLRTLPTQPAVYAILAFAVLGIVAYTGALACGEVATVTGVLVVTEAIVPGLAGLALLGDTVRPGWALPCALGMLLAVGGVVILIRSPAAHAAPGAPARLGRRPRAGGTPAGGPGTPAGGGERGTRPG